MRILTLLVLLPFFPGWASAGAARQTCPPIPSRTENLDSGAYGPSLPAAPVLWTPDGAPVLGGPFSVALRGAPASGAGLFLFSASSLPVFLPRYQVTFFPSVVGLASETLVTDGAGNSSPALVAPALDPVLCGQELFVQGAVLDPRFPGGAAFSNSLRLRVGAISRNPLSRIEIETVHCATSSVPADFDRDGRTDFAVVTRGDVPDCDAYDCFYEYYIETFLARADGTFVPSEMWSRGWFSFPPGLASYDLNGDTFLDLVYDSVAYGRGDGTFEAPVAAPVLGMWAYEVDWDEDGDVDAIRSEAGRLRLYEGDGAGGFTEISPVTFPGSLRAFAFAQLDGQPGLDLAVMLPTPFEVLIYFNDGNNQFVPTSIVSVGSSPMTVIDANGDGLADLLTRSQLSFDYELRLNQGAGAFGAPIPLPFEGSRPRLRIFDLDHDGLDDLLVWESRAGSGQITALTSRGDGTFDRLARITVGPGGSGPEPFEDGQGLAFAVVEATESLADGMLRLQRFQPSGELRGPKRLALSDCPEDVVAGDLDGDGDADALASLPGQIVGLLNEGSAEFAEIVAASGPSDSDAYFGMSLADANGDGLLDLAALDPSAGSLEVRPGEGTGLFGSPVVDLSLVGNPAGVDRLEFADVNNDGHVDLLLSRRHASGGGVFLGNGDGTFQPLSSSPALSASEGFSTDDFDQDGVVDLMSLKSASGPEFYLGQGDGTFGSPFPTTLGSGAWAVVGDFDRDGNVDLSVASALEIRVASGHGDGTFSAPTILPVTGVHGLLSGDFDGDGGVDLLAPRDFGTVWFHGQELLTGATPHAFYTGEGPKSFDVADFDGNGTLDLLQGAASDFAVWIVLNRTGTGF